jgi:CBS domain containing-hemolysin-like protein
MEDPHTPLELGTFGWRLAATLFFVLLNGFFVAAEFALVKVRATQLEARAAEGSKAARVAQAIHAHMNRYLSACQLGITLASLILGWLAEPAIAELILAAAERSGYPLAAEDPLLHAGALGIALTLVTVFHMTLGEQAPKLWAIRRAESTSLQVAYPLRAFAAVFRPFIWLIDRISNAILRVAGLPPEALHESSHSVEELRSALATSAEAGHITSRQREFAENILGIMGLEVRHILVPRVDVAYLSLQSTVEENLRTIRDTGHSRFPLCRVGLDTVVGIVHAKDVMSAQFDQAPVDLEALARKPVFVPDTQPLSRFILLLQRERSHSAVAVDEHGTAIGLVFLEDALEEIVGPIQDEFDQEADAIHEIRPGVFEIEGGVSLPEAGEVLGLGNLGEEADTIGGHVTALLGRLPRKNDRLSLGPYGVRIVEVAGHRVGKLQFELSAGPETKSD